MSKGYEAEATWRALFTQFDHPDERPQHPPQRFSQHMRKACSPVPVHCV